MTDFDPSAADSQPSDIDAVPVSIEREADAAIVITWSDNRVTRWSVVKLRKSCPCATCREKKRGEAAETKSAGKPPMLPVLSPAEARPLRIESMRPVGSYAYNIAFSDGHSSGIYPFALLRESS